MASNCFVVNYKTTYICFTLNGFKIPILTISQHSLKTYCTDLLCKTSFSPSVWKAPTEYFRQCVGESTGKLPPVHYQEVRTILFEFDSPYYARDFGTNALEVSFSQIVPYRCEFHDMTSVLCQKRQVTAFLGVQNPCKLVNEKCDRHLSLLLQGVQKR